MNLTSFLCDVGATLNTYNNTFIPQHHQVGIEGVFSVVEICKGM